MSPVPGGRKLEAPLGFLFSFGFSPTFQNLVPNLVPDSGLEGSGLWSVEVKERRVNGLALGSMKREVIVLFFLKKNGFQQGSL